MVASTGLRGGCVQAMADFVSPQAARSWAQAGVAAPRPASITAQRPREPGAAGGTSAERCMKPPDRSAALTETRLPRMSHRPDEATPRCMGATDCPGGACLSGSHGSGQVPSPRPRARACGRGEWSPRPTPMSSRCWAPRWRAGSMRSHAPSTARAEHLCSLGDGERLPGREPGLHLVAAPSPTPPTGSRVEPSDRVFCSGLSGR